MERKYRVVTNAEKVHFVASKTRWVAVGTTLVGGILFNLPVLIGGTIGWSVSMGADALAKRRIKLNLSSVEIDNSSQLEGGSDNLVR